MTSSGRREKIGFTAADDATSPLKRPTRGKTKNSFSPHTSQVARTPYRSSFRWE